MTGFGMQTNIWVYSCLVNNIYFLVRDLLICQKDGCLTAHVLLKRCPQCGHVNAGS